jgi:uncharacterized heparinase superfamily protein
MNLMQLLRTVRHLRGKQVVGQVTHRLRRTWEDPARILSYTVPQFQQCAWKPRKPFLAPRYPSPDEMLAGRFTFINRTETLHWPPDWDCLYLPKLWQYNLHYCDHLWGLGFDDSCKMALDWIEHHTPRCGRVGWEPYPTSLRLMNWCAVFFEKFRSQIENDVPARDKIWQSIWRQSEWLSRHLETHLMGNHLLENAAALTVVGSCFAGDDPGRWLQRGLDLLRKQLAEQVLADGGHFERSPMYHTRVVYVLAMLSNIGRDEIDQIVAEPLARATAAMKRLTHPDGRIALLSDSAFDIYNDPTELAEYLGSPQSAPPGNFALPETGYFGARTADGSYIICDAGPIGPDYLPGHAHGDMLSFELSLRGHRVITDSGVYDYARSPQRSYCRSTAAHNTVEINGQSQCEFWDVFRVGRRGTVHDVAFDSRDDGFTLSAWHDGYCQQQSCTRHHRTFNWRHNGLLSIEDTITTDSPVHFVSRLHLHPDCSIISQTPEAVGVRYPAGDFAIRFGGPGYLTVTSSSYFPQFNREYNRPLIELRGRVYARAAFRWEIGHRA